MISIFKTAIRQVVNLFYNLKLVIKAFDPSTVLKYALILAFSFAFLSYNSVQVFSQANPGQGTPPNQQPTQVGVPLPNQTSSTISSISQQSTTSNISSQAYSPAVPADFNPGNQTVRSGGLSTFFGILIIITGSAVSYFYWKKNTLKKSLKMSEKKLSR